MGRGSGSPWRGSLLPPPANHTHTGATTDNTNTNTHALPPSRRATRSTTPPTGAAPSGSTSTCWRCRRAHGRGEGEGRARSCACKPTRRSSPAVRVAHRADLACNLLSCPLWLSSCLAHLLTHTTSPSPPPTHTHHARTQALRHYARQPGPHGAAAGALAADLRAALLSNLVRQYQASGEALQYQGGAANTHACPQAGWGRDLRDASPPSPHTLTQTTGYLWEQYDDASGEGRGCRPFTGWTGLLPLLAAEDE